MSTHTLMDADTAEPIGPATPEQIDASADAAAKDGGAGIIVVGDDSRVIPAGGWRRGDEGRRCYTEEA